MKNATIALTPNGTYGTAANNSNFIFYEDGGVVGYNTEYKMVTAHIRTIDSK